MSKAADGSTNTDHWFEQSEITWTRDVSVVEATNTQLEEV